MSEIKEKLIGIDPKYIFFQHLINEIIPNIADKDDTFSPILCQDDGIDVASRNDIKTFFKLSRDFYVFQYCVNQTNKFKDYSAAWLPLVLLGDDWSQYLKNCTGFEFSPQLDRVEWIKMVPVGKNEEYSFSTILKKTIKNIDAKQYDEFEQKIKQKFNLLTTYYPEKKSLQIHSNSIKISCKGDDAFSLCTGLVPHWLDLLLRWDAIAKIIFNYPYEISAQYPLKSACLTIIIIPYLPHKWTHQAELAVTELSEDLSLYIDSPFYIALTSNSEEFLPLIEKYLNNISNKFKPIYNLLTNGIKSGKTPKHHAIIPFYHILSSKHIGFNENITIRASNIKDFPNIINLFRTLDSSDKDKGEKKRLIPVDLLKIKPKIFSSELFSRVGSINYLIMALNIFSVFLGKIISEIKDEKENSSDGDKNEKRIISRYGTPEHTEIIRKDIVNTRDMVVEILKIVKKNLETIKELISYYDQYIKHTTEQEWKFLFTEEKQNDIFTTVCKKLIKMAVDAERKETRIKALASILYLLNPDDVIPDYDPDGFIDDEFVIASSLREIHEEGELDTALIDFYKAYFYSVDEKINTEIRKNVLKQLDYIRNVLQS